MMKPEEALAIVNDILKPRQLNETEKLVLLKTFSGMRYEEISEAIQYDTSYVRDVGARIWRSLSEALGCKVTKKNIQLRLDEFSHNAGYTVKIHVFPSEAALISTPGSLICQGSSQFVRRSKLEQKIYKEIHKPGSIVSLKASHKMGKTSLARQVIQSLKNSKFHIVYISLEQADYDTTKNLSKLLRWVIVSIEQQLGIPSELDSYWLEEAGSKVSCTAYLQEFLLPRMEWPCILTIDEICCLSETPSVFQDFLAMLRHWHEQAALSEVWRKLRLLLVCGTETYIPLDLEYSPLNVGLSIRLPGFTVTQAYQLGKSYPPEKLELPLEDVEVLVKLVGGHPYLLHLTFQHLFEESKSLKIFLKKSGYYNGIYHNFLRRKLSMLRQKPDLLSSFTQILSDAQNAYTLSTETYQLESMGLIKSQNGSLVLQCPLYQEMMVGEIAYRKVLI